MPYIPKENREALEPEIVLLAAKLVGGGCNAGELNYIVSRLCNTVFDTNPSYSRGNTVMGVLECAKAEFYRRKLAPYEDKKIIENGDI